jgi:hypothetical protein
MNSFGFSKVYKFRPSTSKLSTPLDISKTEPQMKIIIQANIRKRFQNPSHDSPNPQKSHSKLRHKLQNLLPPCGLHRSMRLRKPVEFNKHPFHDPLFGAKSNNFQSWKSSRERWRHGERGTGTRERGGYPGPTGWGDRGTGCSRSAPLRGLSPSAAQEEQPSP